MRFVETELPGAFVIELEPRTDGRGFFARTWCQEEFAERGLSTRIVQCNIGHSVEAGTVRGLHYQDVPYAEAKVVRCSRGALFDVMVDLRPSSPTYGRWSGRELSEDDHRLIYIPEGVAHGYQTLVEHTEIFYQTSAPYQPQSTAGVRYDDPAFGICWPLEVTALSDADRSWPDFRRLEATECHATRGAP